MKEEPLDPRSTGRRRGRKVLEDIGRPYWCGSTRNNSPDSYTSELITRKDGTTVYVGCGRSPKERNAPGGYYPNMGQLQVNHINKNILDNDPVNLEWLCPSCHKDKDSQTDVGVSVKDNEFGFNLLDNVSLVSDEEDLI